MCEYVYILMLIMDHVILWLIIPDYTFDYDWCEANLSGLWWTAYLFVWMGRRHAELVWLACLVSARG